MFGYLDPWGSRQCRYAWRTKGIDITPTNGETARFVLTGPLFITINWPIIQERIQSAMPLKTRSQ